MTDFAAYSRSGTTILYRVSGAVSPVIRRGNAQATIYADNADRRQFLQTLADVVTRYHWRC
jgi:hypothetical protein